MSDHEHIDPALLAPNTTAMLLLRNPQVAQVNADGSRTELAPDPRWLEWAESPLIADPADCEHGETVCAECADSWGIDYYIRFYQDGHLIWTSPDYPQDPTPEENR